MAIRTRITYEILDLVRERAMEQDWELIFDSGPADGRTIIWEKEAGLGRHYELEIRFSPDGRIAHAEKRRDGKWIHRKYEMNDFSSTDVQIETLRMI